MKGASIWAVALAAALTFACGDNSSIDDNTVGGDRTAGTAKPNANPNADTGAAGTAGASREPGATAPMARANNADDANRFVEKMGHVGAAEIKLGQLAAERASHAEVKQFGRRMVAEHQKANSELKQVASKMSVTLPAQPDEKHQELADRLSKLKGAEFDREYMKAMVEGHEEVARELERHAGPAARPGERSVGTTGDASAGANASLSAWASKTLPDVRQHLEQARQIQAKLTPASR
jgi:putative membrane protein